MVAISLCWLQPRVLKLESNFYPCWCLSQNVTCGKLGKWKYTMFLKQVNSILMLTVNFQHSWRIAGLSLLYSEQNRQQRTVSLDSCGHLEYCPRGIDSPAWQTALPNWIKILFPLTLPAQICLSFAGGMKSLPWDNFRVKDSNIHRVSGLAEMSLWDNNISRLEGK